MYAIESDGIRVEAETEKQAKRELRKALATANLERARLEAIDAAAMTAARLNAWRIYDMFHDPHHSESAPPAWINYAADGDYIRHVAKHERSGVDGWGGRFTVHHHNGTASVETWRLDVVSVIIDGGGWPIAVYTCDRDGGKQLWAIGCDGETARLQAMYGVPIEWFRNRE